MRDVSLIQKELPELTGMRARLGSPNIKMRLGAISPEAERQLIEEWKAEWRPLSLTELYELRTELIRILDEARRRDLEEPGRVPGYSYIPGMRVRAMDELIEEKSGEIPEPIPVGPNDSRVIFQQSRFFLAIEPIRLPGGVGPIIYGASIFILASYDVPDKANFTKRYVGEEIIVRSYEPIAPMLETGKTYQGYVYWVGDERGGTFYIRNIIEASEEEDPRLRTLEEQIRILEEKLAALKAEIARLEAGIGMTEEEKAMLAEMDRLIAEETTKAEEVEARIPPAQIRVEQEKAAIDSLRREIPAWNARMEAVRTLGFAMETQDSSRGLSWNWMYRVKGPYEICKPLWDGVIDQFSRQSTCSNNMYALWITIEGKNYAGYYCRPSGGDIPNAQVVDTLVYYAQGKIAELESQIREHTATLHNLEAELRDLQDALEYHQRRAWDLKASRGRVSLEIRRAIALRQAEVDAAKARYELELRTLDNLRAAYNSLIKEIDLARTQAILEAARQRLELLQASEEDKLAIAQEQIRIAEEAEAKAEKAAGAERDEYLDQMRRALESAKEAQEAAINTAKEREATAKEMAALQAELTRIEMELEDARRELAQTQERKEEAEREVAGLPVIPTWGWAALGIAGATLSAVGIGIALKKKKR